MTSREPGFPSAIALSRRRFLALGGAATAAAALGVSNAGSAAAATAQLSLDFENGSLGPPITKYAGAAVSTAYAHSGQYGCRLDPARTSSHVAYLDVDRSGFALGKPYATFSMYFRLVTAPKATDNYMNLFEIGNTSTAKEKSQFTVFFRNNRLTCDFGWNESLDLGAVPSLGQWHLIQAIVHFGSTTYTAQVSLDGAPPVALTSANNKTVQSVRALWLHYPGVAVDYTMDVDDIQMATSDTQPAFFIPPVASTSSSGVVPFSESFERGALGSRPKAGDTAYDQVIGDSGAGNGTVAAVFAADGVRGQCMRFYNTKVASSTYGYLGKRVDTQRRIFLRRYYRLSTFPQYRTSVLAYRSGGSGNGQFNGTHDGGFAFGGGGQSHRFVLVRGDANGTVSKSTVPVGTWFRAEAMLDFTSGMGIQTVRIFLGPNLNGTVTDETLQGSLLSSYVDYVEDGILTNPNVLLSVSIDEVVNDADWPGPVQ